MEGCTEINTVKAGWRVDKLKSQLVSGSFVPIAGGFMVSQQTSIFGDFRFLAEGEEYRAFGCDPLLKHNLNQQLMLLLMGKHETSGSGFEVSFSAEQSTVTVTAKSSEYSWTLKSPNGNVVLNGRDHLELLQGDTRLKSFDYSNTCATLARSVSVKRGTLPMILREVSHYLNVLLVVSDAVGDGTKWYIIGSGSYSEVKGGVVRPVGVNVVSIVSSSHIYGLDRKVLTHDVRQGRGV